MSKKKTAYVATYNARNERVKVYVICKDGGLDNIEYTKQLPTLSSTAAIYRIDLNKVAGIIEERRIYIDDIIYIIFNVYYLEAGKLKNYHHTMEVTREDIYTDNATYKIIDERNKIAKEVYMRTIKTAQAHVTA